MSFLVFEPNKLNLLCVDTRGHFVTPGCSSPSSADTRRKRKRIRKGNGSARVRKSTVERNMNAPAARKRKAKTKSGRENQMERKETSRLV